MDMRIVAIFIYNYLPNNSTWISNLTHQKWILYSPAPHKPFLLMSINVNKPYIQVFTSKNLKTSLILSLYWPPIPASLILYLPNILISPFFIFIVSFTLIKSTNISSLPNDVIFTPSTLQSVLCIGVRKVFLQRYSSTSLFCLRVCSGFPQNLKNPASTLWPSKPVWVAPLSPSSSVPPSLTYHRPPLPLVTAFLCSLNLPSCTFQGLWALVGCPSTGRDILPLDLYYSSDCLEHSVCSININSFLIDGWPFKVYKSKFYSFNLYFKCFRGIFYIKKPEVKYY